MIIRDMYVDLSGVKIQISRIFQKGSLVIKRSPNRKSGNKLSNIHRSGNFAKPGDWVYCGDAGIWKILENERYVHHLVTDQENNVAFLNVIGDWIYSNAQDNWNIYEIKKNGSNRQKFVNARAIYLHAVNAKFGRVLDILDQTFDQVYPTTFMTMMIKTS